MTLIDRLSKLDGPDREEFWANYRVMRSQIKSGMSVHEILKSKMDENAAALLRAKEASHGE